jgi:hypothetical protein
MAIPGRVDAALLLLSLNPPPWFLRHVRAVGEIGGWLAARVAEREPGFDRTIVETAAFLHDVDKLLPPSHPARQLPHGAAAAAWLTEQGHEELGPLIVNHPVTHLVAESWYSEWIETASPGELIVAYADKRAGQRLETVDARFDAWLRRYPLLEDGGREGAWSRETLAQVRCHVARLEMRVCEAANVSPEEVRRLPWTASALRRARIRRGEDPGLGTARDTGR